MRRESARASYGSATAFTLVEVMIAMVLGVLAIFSFSSVITSQLRSNRFQELGLRSRDDANRFNYFVATETADQSLSTEEIV